MARYQDDADARRESSGRLAAWIGIYLRGFCMGAADSVPGVSGGTIALITGIYDRLVAAITGLDPLVLLRVGRTTLQSREDSGVTLRTAARAMDLPFLVVLGLGIMSALVTAAHVVSVAMVSYRALTFAFFFGLIAASAVVLADEVSVTSPSGAATALAGFGLAFVVTGLPEGSLPHTPVAVFASGAVAVSAMVLPGVSGSLLLLVLGQYAFMLGALRTFVDGLAGLAVGDGAGPLPEVTVTIVAFVAGAVVGLLSVAHLVDRALSRHRTATLTFLVSLMVGSLRRPSAEVLAAVDAWTVTTMGALVVALVVGAGLVIGFDRYVGVEY